MASQPVGDKLWQGEPPGQLSGLLGSPSPPPYHETDAYPRVRARRLRRFFSPPLAMALALVLTCAVSLLCLLIRREASLHASTDRTFSALELAQFEASLAKCAALRKFPVRIEPSTRTSNPRWNPVNGQNATVVLRNVTLFDGEAFVPSTVDIVFKKGLVVSVSAASSFLGGTAEAEAKVYDLNGSFVTPGLVDMHSHQMLGPWPALQSTEDTNEMHPDFGPLTPFVRSIDSMHAWDVATAIIASGGVTSSLLIPGSGNIMGGEGAPVKNRLRSGPNGEYVVEEALLEHGVPPDERLRYMKMACGENPKSQYGHTRMGNAWVLRRHLERARELREGQDTWCSAAERLVAAGAGPAERRGFVERAGGGVPEELELEPTVGMLRGRVAMHNHCYMPEDFETMLRVSHEFGFRVRAFHHAISAWLVPEMIKELGDNITVATFAEFSLYKYEAYQASLYAGKILTDHDVPLAYKSDHAVDATSAKYLMLQAAVGHSFHVPAEKALQAVTSVPAKAIDLDYRIGYVRPGYDADIVIWDSHPLSVGATPAQVFIDGVATLDPAKVEASMGRPGSGSKTPASSFVAGETGQPAMRATIAEEEKVKVCSSSSATNGAVNSSFVISGIRRSFLENYPELLGSVYGSDDTEANLTLVINDGDMVCLGSHALCAQSAGSDAVPVHLSNGYLAPGLTAVSHSLGLSEISMEPTTGDGAASPFLDPRDPDNVDFAKHGVVFDGKAFARARLGGVTRAVTAPLELGGLVQGVSAGIRTGGGRTAVDGGIFCGDVALHVQVGDMARISDSALSMAVRRLRGILRENAGKGGGGGHGNVYGRVADGDLPLVVQADSRHDIEQAILLKRDFEKVDIVILGGAAAHLLADELVEAGIPVILLANRGSPDSWANKDALAGPPLSRSPASILTEAGVDYAITVPAFIGDSRIHDLALEAAWAAKFAGLGDREAVRLVSYNVERILRLPPSRDVVVWEGSPLGFGGSPVLVFEEQQQAGGGEGEGEGGSGGRGLMLSSCWPGEGDE